MVSCVFQALLLFHQKVNWNLLERQLANGNAMKKILSLLTTLLLLAACSPNELGTPFYAGQEVSITAAFSSSKNNDGKKRISGKDNVDRIDLTWDEGDEILVTVGDQSAVFTLSSGAGTNNATFTGIMPADGSNFHVSYPIDYTDEVLTNQTYTANGFGKGLMKMSTKLAGTLDKGFTLSADNALLGLKLQGDANVSKIVLTNNDNQKTYTLDCSTQVVNTADGALFYIVLPAGTWQNGMKVEVYNTDGVVIETKEKHDAITFSANNAMVMPEVEVYNTMEFEVNGVKFKMVFVEGGTFMMGATEEQLPYAQANEEPVHQVTLSDYMVGQTEVTQELWTAVMGTTLQQHAATHPTSSTIAGEGNTHPMYMINKADCQEFIDKLNIMTGMYFRLPTEAEWEYAARGGQKSRGFIYAGSNNIDDVAWYVGNSDGKTHDVGTKQPNELGIFDMSGNVWEWIYDRSGNYSAGTQINPNGPTTGDYCILRGGSRGWGDYNTTRVSARKIDYAADVRSFVGLRLVLDTHTYVDLGLSVMWAICNVGASAPEEYGDYFAWGETEAKQNFSWEIYKWCNSTKSTITKYNATDGLTTLLPEDDAAHVNWGGQWRMPTKEELTELREQCTWKWVTINGIKGNKVTGPNGNSIFLPAGGSYNTFDDQLNSAGVHGWIYSSTKSSVDNQAQEMGTSSSGAAQTSCSRCLGLNIRPVLPKN